MMPTRSRGARPQLSRLVGEVDTDHGLDHGFHFAQKVSDERAEPALEMKEVLADDRLGRADERAGGRLPDMTAASMHSALKPVSIHAPAR